MLCIQFNSIAIIRIAPFARLCLKGGILYTLKTFVWPTHFTVRGGLGTYNFHCFATFHCSARTKPESEMSCVCIRGIDFVFSYDFWYLRLELFPQCGIFFSLYNILYIYYRSIYIYNTFTAGYLITVLSVRCALSNPDNYICRLHNCQVSVNTERIIYIIYK